MQAARERPQRERVRRQALDRSVGAVDPRVEADVDVDAGDRDDPEQEEREAAEVPPGVARLAEGAVERRPRPRSCTRARRGPPAQPGLPVEYPAILGVEVDHQHPAGLEVDRARADDVVAAGDAVLHLRDEAVLARGNRSAAVDRSRRRRGTAPSAARPARTAACRPSRSRPRPVRARAGTRCRRACWARAWRAPRRCARGRLPCAAPRAAARASPAPHPPAGGRRPARSRSSRPRR